MNDKQAEEMIGLLKQIWYKLDSIEESLGDLNAKSDSSEIPESINEILKDVNRQMNSGKNRF